MTVSRQPQPTGNARRRHLTRPASAIAVMVLALTTVAAVGGTDEVTGSPLPKAAVAGVAPEATLRQLASARGVRIGATIDDTTALNEPAYAALFAREFDIGVSENAMKWGPIHPAPTTFNYEHGDAQVAFAGSHGSAFRGHNLAWHNQNPDWLLAGPFTRDERIQQLQDHIREVVGHYKGRVAQWDVVNEAFDGLADPAHDPWSAEIGFPDYLDIAFRAAHEADPAARLFYNDYWLESPNSKFDKVIELVSGLRARGVPIHGVGFQTHQWSHPCTDVCANEVLGNMLRLQAMGLEVAITEMDVAIELPVTPEKLDEQASVYRSVLQACLLAPNCHTFVMWGFTDKYSWIPATYHRYGAALPFDEQYRPKPAYAAILATLANPPAAPSCASFVTQGEAQAAFKAPVLGAPLLDSDGNGRACEQLPANTPVPVPSPAPAPAPLASPAPAPAPVPVLVSPNFTG